MGLFEKIKKVAPAISTTAAVTATGAAGLFAGHGSAKEKEIDHEAKDQNLDASTFSDQVDNSVPSNQINEVIESIYDPETGVTNHEFSNGNTLTEYPDGSRIFYDTNSDETSEYNAQTGETIIHEADGDVVTLAQDGSRWTREVNDEGIVFQLPDEQLSSINTSNNPWECTPQEFQDLPTSHSESAGSLFETIKEMDNDLPDSVKAVGIGIPDHPVQEFRTYQEGNIEDRHISYGYEGSVGWESNYNTTYSGQDEVTPGISLNSEASYKSHGFIGLAINGEVSAKWNDEQAHLSAQGRIMVGAESNVEGDYKGNLNIDGLDYQPGAEVHGDAKAFVGAEVQGQGDILLSEDNARAKVGAEAFAGSKAEVDYGGALSVDGKDFARGEGGLDARAGISVNALLDIGYQDEKIHYGADIGAAIGVGAGLHYSGSVDAPGIITHPGAVWESIEDKVIDYIPDVTIPDMDPINIREQVESYIPIPDEVNHVAEVLTNPIDALKDSFDDIFG
jgi:hypothetical protein